MRIIALRGVPPREEQRKLVRLSTVCLVRTVDRVTVACIERSLLRYRTGTVVRSAENNLIQ